MNYLAYLQRFNATESIGPSIDDLFELQSLHMRHVPFENLDVIRKVPIYLNLDNFYNKIVERQRGGFCYEVNGLFHWLLQGLGYEAHLSAATVMRPNGEYAKLETHVVILVQLERAYLVDVGFGNSPRYPVAMDGTEQTDISGTYKVEQTGDTDFLLLKKTANDWRTVYKFNTIRKDISDFHEGCVYNQVAKESTFTHHDIVTIATSDGRITLRDNTITTTSDGQKQTKEITDSEKTAVLKTVFNLNLD